MKKALNILLALMLVGIYSCKKEVDVNNEDHGKSFIKMYGTLSEGADIAETADGGYFLVGTTQGALNKDILLVKTDRFGNTQWSRSYAGPSSGSENIASSIELLSDGGVAILATSTLIDTSENQINSTYLLITDALGFKQKDAIWNSGVVDPVPENERAYGLAVSAEGEEKLYFVSERETSAGINVGIIRRYTVNTGAWVEEIISQGVDLGLRDVSYHSLNDVRVCGYVDLLADSAYDYCYYRIEDKEDNLSTTNPASSGTGETEIANCIIQTSDGNQILCGSATLATGVKEFVASKVIGLGDNENPDVEWTYRGSDLNLDNTESYSVAEVSDGYILAGYTQGLDRQMHLVKINSTGSSVLWQRDYGFTSFDEAKKVVESSDGGIMVLGTSSDERGNSVMTLLKLDSKGNLLQ